MQKSEKLKLAYAAMRAAFPGWAKMQDSESIRFWGECLDDIEHNRLIDAIRCLVKCSKFAPSIAEIREAAWADEPDRKDPAKLEQARRHREWAAREDARVQSELAVGVTQESIEAARKAIAEAMK